jgi:hypothetical protein
LYLLSKKKPSVSANILEKSKGEGSISRQNIYFYLGYTEQGSDFNFVQKCQLKLWGDTKNWGVISQGQLGSHVFDQQSILSGKLEKTREGTSKKQF